MPAQIQEFADYWKVWNDQDEWFVEKTGIQMSNDYGSPWAKIWAGFATKTGPNWTYHLFDEEPWVWTTDSGSGWVKLIGDAEFVNAKIVVHVEWILEDDDALLEVKWRMVNNFKDVENSKMVVRNGQLQVNGAAENWYRFYKTDNTIVDGQLPADVSYNSVTDSLKPRYKIIGDSKDIDWRWDETWDDNGTPASSNVDVGCVDVDGKYGSNGYVYHEFNTGAWNKGDYKEVTMHWHDGATYYLATLRVFEMSGGTNRNYVADGGNTVDSDKWFGYYRSPRLDHRSTKTLDDADDKFAVKLSEIDSIEKVAFRAAKDGSPNFTLRISIQSDNAGEPSGTILGASNNAYAELDDSDLSISETAEEVTLLEIADPARTDIIWLVFDFSSYTSGSVVIGTTSSANDHSSLGCYGTRFYETASWDALANTEFPCFMLYGKSDLGHVCPSTLYSVNASCMVGFIPDYYPQIKNDESTLYRTVFQIKPLDDDWKATKDGDEEAYFISDNTVDWNFHEAGSAPDAKAFWDNQFGPTSTEDAIYTGDSATDLQDEEWNGTDTNIPQVTSDGPPVHCGDWDNSAGVGAAITNQNGDGNWEDNSCWALTLPQGKWGMAEWWFKVTDNFVVGNEPEWKFTLPDGGGGGTALVGCRATYKIIAAEAPAFEGLAPFMALV